MTGYFLEVEKYGFYNADPSDTEILRKEIIQSNRMHDELNNATQ